MNPVDSLGPLDEEYSLPCAEALFAGTLALMTGYAQSDSGSIREAMGHKIVHNLHLLGQLELLTPHFRAMLGSLQARWLQQCRMAGAEVKSPALTAAEQHRALWLAAPQALQ